MRYKYTPTQDDDINRLILIFDRQIENEYPINNGNKFRCPSYWHKLIFLESLNMSIEHWRVLRDDEYYIIKDTLKGTDKLSFTLEKIQEFKKKYSVNAFILK